MIDDKVVMSAAEDFVKVPRAFSAEEARKIVQDANRTIAELERLKKEWRHLFEQAIGVVPGAAHTLDWARRRLDEVDEHRRRKELAVKRVIDRNRELRAALAYHRSMAHFTIAGQTVSPKSTAAETAAEIKEAIVGAIKVGADSLEAEVSKVEGVELVELTPPNQVMVEFVPDLEKLGERAYTSMIGEHKVASLTEQLKAAQAKVAELQTELDAITNKDRRHRLPLERKAVTKKLVIGLDPKTSLEVFVTAGMYDDDTLGEIFLVASKEGSFVSGLLDAFATSVSLGLQYGVPVKTYVDRFSHMRFEPDGMTGDPQFPIAKSVVDYLFRWIGARFLPPAPEPTTKEGA